MGNETFIGIAKSERGGILRTGGVLLTFSMLETGDISKSGRDPLRGGGAYPLIWSRAGVRPLNIYSKTSEKPQNLRTPSKLTTHRKDLALLSLAVIESSSFVSVWLCIV